MPASTFSSPTHPDAPLADSGVPNLNEAPETLLKLQSTAPANTGDGVVMTERKRAEEVVREVSSRHEAAAGKRRFRDAVFALMAIAAMTAGIMATDATRMTLDWLEDLHPALDNAVVATGVAVIGLAGFLYRRRELRERGNQEAQVRQALFSLQGELECRIQARTGQLAATNEQLRVEAASHRRTADALRTSEERFRLMAETIDQVFYMCDVGLKEMTYVSAAYEKLWGRSRESVYREPQSFAEAVHPEDRRVLTEILRSHAAGEPFSLTYRIHQADGAERYILDRGYPVRNAAGQVTGYVGSAQDITEREKARNVLAESERRYREMLANVELIAVTLDPAGRITFCNDYLARLTGWRTDELIGRDWFETFIPAGERDELRRLFFEAITSEPILAHYDNPILTRSGELREIHWNNTALRSAGKIVGILSVGEDVTEYHRADAEARRLAAVVSSSEDAIISKDLAGAISSWNPAAMAMFGYAEAEIIGRRVETLIPPERAGEEIEFNVQLKGDAGKHTYETVRMRKDGRRIDVAVTVSPIHDPEGKIVGASEIVRDITERKRAEFRLGLEHAITGILAEGATLGDTLQRSLETLGRGLGWSFGEAWMMDRGGKSLKGAEIWHEGGTDLEGFGELTHQLTLAVGDALPGRVAETGEAGWTIDIAKEVKCLRKASAARAGLRAWIGFPIKIAGETVAVMSFFSRVTLEPDRELLACLTAIGGQLGQFIERQHLAEQYRQAQKLEAIGTLAGGIAHDFNNIIAAITGYTELAKMDLSDRPEVVDHLNAVACASERAAGLVRQILAFSRQQEQERKPIQLRHIINKAMKLLRATVPTMIEFEVSLPTDVSPVLADPTQVHQVMMNLVTNACHAMNNQPGRLGVAMENWDVDEDLARAHPGLRPGRYVRLSVSDSGHGMDPATMSRIFEPFFTTKGPREGTGLGLAVVHGIMQAHEGAVTVYSQPGEGTIFRLYFPALAAAATEHSPESAITPAGAGQRILFVDDEAVLAGLGGKILGRLGYKVQTETNPRRALELIRATPSAYDLIVTDLAMPVMTGTDLARELHVIRADLPVLLATGYSATLTPARVKAMGIADLLQKPLSASALGTAVHRALHSNP